MASISSINSRILVTGGAGFIGSQTCKELSKNGYEVLVYDNLSTGFRDNIKWSEFVEGDLLDREKLSGTLSSFKPDGVIHFAASAYVGESVLNPIKYFKNNVIGTLNLIETMLELKIKKLVFSSTCATYGISNSKKISEADVQKPINPYGQSKLIIENILREISQVDELSFVAFRYFNAAGADLDLELVERHNPETHLIPLAIQSAISDYELKVFGNDYPTADGTAVRDYIHVQDLAEAHILGLQNITGNARNEFFNLGTGQGISVFEIIDVIKNFGLTPKFSITKRRDGDPPVLVSDATKIKNFLGWQAKYSDVETIINSVLRAL